MNNSRMLSYLSGLLLCLSAPFTQAAITRYCCDATAEAAYKAAIAAAYDTAHESFETGEWTNVRFFNSLPSVTNIGVTWAPIAASGRTAAITTFSGDFHDLDPLVMSGYEMFTMDTSTFTHALPDGYTLSTGFTLYGVGGWFRGTNSKLSFTLPDGSLVGFTGAEKTVTDWTFLGFIETAGFNSLEIRTSDETGNEANVFWSDDFNFGAEVGSFVDSDGDGILDLVDNCPAIANADQLDTDSDGAGDVCDIDDDGDAVLDANDNCPLIANLDQADADNDGVGDVCDPLTDTDGDGVADSTDNCLLISNPGQEDLDNDGAGDVCDPDVDGDNVPDTTDNCPLIPNVDQLDTDGDLTGDVCDSDDDNDTVLDIDDNCPLTVNTNQADSDGDGIGDVCDPFNDFDDDGIADSVDNCPSIPNFDQLDTDGDGVGDACDPLTDSDGDGLADASDNCPAVTNVDQTDTDGDGAGDACDTDDDNDGVLDGADLCPNPSAGATVDVNGCSATQLDSDNDGISDAADNCPLIANADQLDTDADSTGDACDTDDDNDTVLDIADNCPVTANTDQLDIDGDGQGDACDTDDDNDGVTDGADNCPVNANANQQDTDGDNAGDACDTDDDNDNVLDTADNCPLIANTDQADADNDGIGDVCDSLTDSDGDGVPDALDSCPNTSAGATVDANGCSVAQLDSDNDGISDAADNCPLIANADQLDTDADSTGDACDTDDDNDTVLDIADNCPSVANADQADTDGDAIGDACDPLTDSDNDGVADQTDICPTTPTGRSVDLDGCSIPVITLSQPDIQVNATAVLTSVDLGDISAFDDEDGVLIPVTEDSTGPFMPGRHEIIWSVTDSSGNNSTATQVVKVIPLASLGPDQLASPGSTATVDVSLNGQAVVYPATIDYQITELAADQTIQNTSTGQIVIPDGELIGSFDYVVPSSSTSTSIVRLQGLVNAVAGLKTSHTISVVEGQIAPTVELHAEQNGRLTRTLVADGGLVLISAEIDDPNVAGNHSFSWSVSDAGITVPADTTSQSFGFDPSALLAGNYSIRVDVTDSEIPGETISVEMVLRVIATHPVLEPSKDSDGDGLSDFEEGIYDEDEDGIPDYLDAISSLEAVPCIQGVEDGWLLNTEAGLKLRLGRIAFVSDNKAAVITSTILADYLATLYQSVASPADSLAHVGGIFDFEVSGLPFAGQSIRIVLPLLSAIPANAIYRKYTEQDGWHDFIVDANNRVASAPGTPGICPPPGDASYVPGLIEGYNCVELLLMDGGPDDADGLVNGLIADPGAVAVTQSPTPSSSGGGGGSIGYAFYFLLLLGILRRHTLIESKSNTLIWEKAR